MLARGIFSIYIWEPIAQNVFRCLRQRPAISEVRQNNFWANYALLKAFTTDLLEGFYWWEISSLWRLQTSKKKKRNQAFIDTDNKNTVVDFSKFVHKLNWVYTWRSKLPLLIPTCYILIALLASQHQNIFWSQHGCWCGMLGRNMHKSLSAHQITSRYTGHKLSALTSQYKSSQVQQHTDDRQQNKQVNLK